MHVFYAYCSHCGWEAFDVYIAYSRSTASGDLWICPGCGREVYEVKREN